MKIYALATLLVCCIAHSALADWKNDVKFNHMLQINSIVNPNLARIQADANIKNTQASQQCYENARLSFKSASDDGYREINSCVSSASTPGVANVCCQQAVSRVFNKSLDISRVASSCISNA